MINAGTRSDDHAFDAKYLPRAEALLTVLLANSHSTISIEDEVVNRTLNSTLGRILRAAINYSLRVARLKPSAKPNERWSGPIREYFERMAVSPNRPLEFSVSVGEYIRNLMYLDEPWVFSNLASLFPAELEDQWEAAFTGYLFYAGQLVRILYDKLKANGDYEKALSTAFKTSHILERAAHHVCTGYNDGLESLEDCESLISKLLATEKPDLIYQVVRFYQMGRGRNSAKHDAKMREIWPFILKIAKKYSSDQEFQKVLSNLCDWLGSLQSLDDEAVTLLKESLKYVEREFNLLLYPEYLLRHVSKSPDQVAELFLALVEEGQLPTYEESQITKVIESLYEVGHKQKTDEICNAYLARNLEFVRPVYVKHQT